MSDRRLLLALALVGRLGTAAGAQDGPIADNSFLIEEAYNQTPGVVQHITTFLRDGEGGDWATSFTQEWPAGGQRHQLSYTLAYLRLDRQDGWGDAAIHYRYQLRGKGGERLAIAPRVSLLVPTGEAGDGLGAGSPGLQVNLPVSARFADAWVSHSNVGGTWIPNAEAPGGARADIGAIQLGQSVVWLLRPRLNLMLESVWTSTESVAGTGATERAEALLVSPGVRVAFDLPGGLQIVPGLAVPIGAGPSAGEWSVFAYLSFEHPF